MRLRCVLAALAVCAPAGASSGSLSSDVWFLQDGRPTAAARSAPGIPGIVRALLASAQAPLITGILHCSGGGLANKRSDRDYLSLNIKYSF